MDKQTHTFKANCPLQQALEKALPMAGFAADLIMDPETVTVALVNLIRSEHRRLLQLDGIDYDTRDEKLTPVEDDKYWVQAHMTIMTPIFREATTQKSIFQHVNDALIPVQLSMEH